MRRLPQVRFRPDFQRQLAARSRFFRTLDALFFAQANQEVVFLSAAEDEERAFDKVRSGDDCGRVVGAMIIQVDSAFGDRPARLPFRFQEAARLAQEGREVDRRAAQLGGTDFFDGTSAKIS